jgi:hypothetical protein
MAFDPSQPFEVVNDPQPEQDAPAAFDPSQPFELEKPQGDPIADRLETLHNTSFDTPENAAKFKQLADSSGVTYEVAKAIPDKIEADSKRIDWKAFTAEAPKVAKHLADDPVAFDMAKDDIGALKDIERFRGELKSRGLPELKNDYSVAALNDSLLKNNTTGSIENTANPDSGAGQNLSSLGVQFAEGMRQWKLGRIQQIGDMARAAGINVGDAKENTAYAKSQARKRENSRTTSNAATPDFSNTLFPVVNDMVYGGASSLVQTAPTMALSMANPVAGLGAMYDQTSSQAYSKYRDRGENAFWSSVGAAGEGAVEVLTEKNPVGFASKALGKMGAWDFMKAFAGKEMLGEQAATILQDGIDASLDKNKTLEQYFAERPEAAVRTMVAVGVTSTVMGATQAVANKVTGFDAEAEKTQRTMFAVQAELGAIKDMAIMKNSPKTLVGLLDAMDENKEDFYIDPAELFQGGVSKDAFLQAVPGAAQEIADAEVNGGLIKVSRNELLVGIKAANNPEMEAEVVRHIKVDAKGRSMAELEAEQGNLSNKLQDLADKAVSQFAEESKGNQDMQDLLAVIKDDLKAAGTPEGNESRAMLWASLANAQGKASGQSAMDVYRQQFRGKVSNESLGGDVFNRDSVEDALIEERDSFRDNPHNEWTSIQQAIYDGVTTSIVDPTNENTRSWLQTAIDNNRLDLAELIVVRAENTANSTSVTPGVSKDSPKYESIKADLEQRKKDHLSAAAGLREALEASRHDSTSESMYKQADAQGKASGQSAMDVYRQQFRGKVSNESLGGDVFNQQNPFTPENGFDTVEEIDFSLPEGFTSLDDGSNVKPSASENGGADGKQPELDEFGDRRTNPDEKNLFLSNFPKSMRFACI